MTPQIQRLFDEAQQLTPRDRVALANELLESVADDLGDELDSPPHVEEEWADELQTRISEMASGAVRGVPWDEVRRQMLKQIDADAD